MLYNHYSWLLLMLHLEVLWRGYAMNQGWPPLVTVLGHFCVYHSVSWLPCAELVAFQLS